MSNLKEIQNRHGWDRWKDAAFIFAAVLMTALALGSVTSQAAGKPTDRPWGVAVQFSDTHVDQNPTP